MDEQKTSDVALEWLFIEAVLHAQKEAYRLCGLVKLHDFTDVSAGVVFIAARELKNTGKPVSESAVRQVLDSPGHRPRVDPEVFKRRTPDAELVPLADRAALQLVAMGRTRRDLEEKRTKANLLTNVYRVSDFASVEQSLPKIEWLWDGWLARGIVSVLASSPGEGKSAIALEIARRVMGSSSAGGDSCVLPASAVVEDGPHIGGPLQEENQEGGHTGPPLQETTRPEGRDVLFVDTEAAEAILRQRVTGWSLPKDRLKVFAMTDPVEGIIHLALDNASDFERIVGAVRELRPPLVVIDSLSGGHAMEENSAKLRGLLLKITMLARNSRSAFLVVHHLRKRARGEPDTASLDRLRGSSTIAQFARIIWAIDRPDPSDPRRRLFQVKNNLVAWPKPVGFTISDKGLAFTEAPSKPQGRTWAEQAVTFIQELLRERPISAAEVFRQATQCGYSRYMIYRASERLGVIKCKQGLGVWVWRLPGDKG